MVQGRFIDVINIVELRKTKGLTQHDLAKIIKKERSLISRIESGEIKPSVETAKAIAAVLNVNWTTFFD